MHLHTPMLVFAVCLSALATAAMAGCSSSDTPDGSSNSGGTMDGGGSSSSPGGGMMDGGSGSDSSTNGFASVGERIYLSGVGTDGQEISRSAPRLSQGALMMGGGGCGSCHAADGRGGTIEMMTGTAIKAPDITYDALIGDGFTDATIRKAIRDGLDESDKPLDDAMPRWQMGDADLAATIAYLKELSAQ